MADNFFWQKEEREVIPRTAINHFERGRMYRKPFRTKLAASTIDSAAAAAAAVRQRHVEAFQKPSKFFFWCY